MKKIGIMGGTFDPIHLGHLIAAQEVTDSLGLAEVIFVPAGKPPLKDTAKVASARHRLMMCMLATNDNDNFSVSTAEIDREGTSYTVDTIAQLKSANPSAELFFIVGADVVSSFHKWRRFDEILAMCKIAVTTRPGSAFNIEAMENYGDRIVPVTISDIDISSTRIRNMLDKGKEPLYFLPNTVISYIHRNGVYSDNFFGHLTESLQIALSAERYEHSASVMREACELGRRHGQNEMALEKIMLAGLLHDCAKNFCDERPFAEIDTFCKEHGVVLDGSFAGTPWLAHSFVGAVKAKAVYGVEDSEVLDAIAAHTFGKPDMTNIDKIIYIADFIEPGRAEDEARSHARGLAYEGLDDAMIFILRHTIEKTTARGLPVYPDSLAALEYLEDNYGKK